jgi:hypothetical protein
MKEVVFLVEEPSMKEFLRGILPRVIPDNVSYTKYTSSARESNSAHKY